MFNLGETLDNRTTGKPPLSSNGRTFFSTKNSTVIICKEVCAENIPLKSEVPIGGAKIFRSENFSLFV